MVVMMMMVMMVVEVAVIYQLHGADTQMWLLLVVMIVLLCRCGCDQGLNERASILL